MRKKERRKLDQINRVFIINAETFNEMTYRSFISRIIIKVDLIDVEIVSSL